MRVRKQQLELDMEQQTGSKQEKEYIKTVYFHPAYLTYMQSTSCECHLDEAQAGINNLRHADDTTLMAEIEKELKILQMKVKEESEELVKTQHSKLRSGHLVLSLLGKQMGKQWKQ